MPETILIADDEANIRDLARLYLEKEGFRVRMAVDGAAALEEVRRDPPALLVLDLMMPRMDGWEVCRRVRAEGNLPILMLTARGQEIDKVVGLKIGADDYVTKPFSFMELIARVEALMRRAHRQVESLDEYRFGEVVVNFKKFEVMRDGSPLEVSAREFNILKYFIEHRGEVITRDQLLDSVWGYGSFPLTRTVDMHIAKLRQKIEETPHDPRHIVTVHRVGYKFIA